jgi:arylsulfatase
MKLPKRLPVLPAWDTLTPDQKTYRSKVLQVHAAMIEHMDSNVGRVIQYLKDIGEYDNTLILFTSDNGTSSTVEMKDVALTGISIEEANGFNVQYDNSAANVGNSNSLVNYGAWGAGKAASPLSYFKASQGEGGIRTPFVIKLPNPSNQSQTEIVRSFVHVNDVTPTLIEYAGVQHPSTYNGSEVHPLMGKSIKLLLDGKVKRIHASDEPIAQRCLTIQLFSWVTGRRLRTYHL